MKMTQEHNKNIIHKFVRGFSSQVEEQKLYQECKKNPKLWREINRAIDGYDPISEPNLYAEEKWKGFEKRLIKRNSTNILPRFYQLLKYAAVVLITLLSYTLIKDSFNNKVQEQKLAFETYVPKGQKSEVKLPDGTVIILNADSRLKYFSDFKDNRKVYLQGEGFFHVAHQLDHPFRVETDFYTTKVLGTQFNLMAYENMSHVKTTLESGSVLIEKGVGGELMELAILKPGEEFVFDVETEKYKVQKANVANVLSWQDNMLVFDNVPLQEIVKALERHFDASISINDKELSQIRYRGKFKNNETLAEVLDIISMTTPIKYSNKKGKIEISKY